MCLYLPSSSISKFSNAYLHKLSLWLFDLRWRHEFKLPVVCSPSLPSTLCQAMCVSMQLKLVRVSDSYSTLQKLWFDLQHLFRFSFNELSILQWSSELWLSYEPVLGYLSWQLLRLFEEQHLPSVWLDLPNLLWSSFKSGKAVKLFYCRASFEWQKYLLMCLFVCFTVLDMPKFLSEV